MEQSASLVEKGSSTRNPISFLISVPCSPNTGVSEDQPLLCLHNSGIRRRHLVAPWVVESIAAHTRLGKGGRLSETECSQRYPSILTTSLRGVAISVDKSAEI